MVFELTPRFSNWLPTNQEWDRLRACLIQTSTLMLRIDQKLEHVRIGLSLVHIRNLRPSLTSSSSFAWAIPVSFRCIMLPFRRILSPSYRFILILLLKSSFGLIWASISFRDSSILRLLKWWQILNLLLEIMYYRVGSQSISYRFFHLKICFHLANWRSCWDCFDFRGS